MRCPRCGNENPGTNRFCGMCGATLLPAPVPVAASQAAAVTTVTRSTPAVSAPADHSSPSQNPALPRPAARPPQPEPSISGPSFLGLNAPAPSSASERRKGSLSIDPNSSSRNLDYLLEDDQPRGGAGKYFLILIALLLAAGFGYLRWRHQGFAWLTDGSKKPAPSIQAEDQPEPAAAVPNASTSSSSSAPADSGSPAAPATTSNSAPASSASTPAAAAPASNTPAPQAAAPTSTPNSTGSAPPSSSSAAKQSDESQDNATDSDSADNPAPEAAATKPRKVPADATSKPSPAPRPRDVVAEAHKYLYGTGARQDCDRGLRLLKPAADHADPKAMVEMGALYSAGLCTPRDLPTAYRWFAIALRKQPDNASVQSDLEKLWGEMTQPERQLAIKLSQ